MFWYLWQNYILNFSDASFLTSEMKSLNNSCQSETIDINFIAIIYENEYNGLGEVEIKRSLILAFGNHYFTILLKLSILLIN